MNVNVDNAPIKLSDRPVINPLYLFRWEEQEKAFLLLYPEGIIKLNDSAGQILNLCGGEKTLEEILIELKQIFSTEDIDSEDIDEDIYKFMEVAIAKGWVRIKA